LAAEIDEGRQAGGEMQMAHGKNSAVESPRRIEFHPRLNLCIRPLRPLARSAPFGDVFSILSKFESTPHAPEETNAALAAIRRPAAI
jgi:hypothetical protein